jgi:hypothetical protein
MGYDEMVFRMFLARRLDPRKTRADEDYARAREDVDAYESARKSWEATVRAKVKAQK